MEHYFRSKHNYNITGAQKASPRCEDVYEFEEIIGSGTFSDVVRGRHKLTNELVAIKIIDKKKIENNKQRQRLQNEIRLHKCCSHSSIVQLLEFFETDIDVCLVLELCEGGELFERLVEKKQKDQTCFSEQQSKRIMFQILSAVKYLHDQGIVHRDIKPENIVCAQRSEDTEVKLADFGLAKQVKKENNGRELLKASASGTTLYCAPERLKQSEESMAVDIWSVGCIMYFIIFGEPPFYSAKEDEDENEAEVMEFVTKGTIQFPPSVHLSEQLKDFLLKLLEKEPQKRITAGSALQHPWMKTESKEMMQVSSSDEKKSIPSNQTSSKEETSNTMSKAKNERNLLKCSINRVIDIEMRDD